MKTDYDILIIGGGMVGASLVKALATSSLSIALVERHDFSQQLQPSYDDRGIALSYGSQRIYDTLDLWSSFSPYSTAINTIHVSQRGHFGATRLNAQQQQVPALGQVLLARTIGTVLNQSLSNQDNLTLFCPNEVTKVTLADSHITIKLTSNKVITAKLVIAADGVNSPIRQQLDLPLNTHDYQQTAITANVTTQAPHHGRAFERFTEAGPIAFLPMSQQRASLVWSANNRFAEQLITANDNDFLNQLQTYFGFYLGHITRIGKRSHYPLKLSYLSETVHHRLIFIGNAAHSLHPIAGQGFNLGLRDVAALAEVLNSSPSDCGHATVLQSYQQWQKPDQQHLVAATDALVKWFQPQHPLLANSRGLALHLLDFFPPLKQQLARYSMGLRTPQTGLVRGHRP